MAFWKKRLIPGRRASQHSPSPAVWVKGKVWFQRGKYRILLYGSPYGFHVVMDQCLSMWVPKSCLPSFIFCTSLQQIFRKCSGREAYLPRGHTNRHVDSKASNTITNKCSLFWMQGTELNHAAGSLPLSSKLCPTTTQLSKSTWICFLVVLPEQRLQIDYGDGI